MMMMMFAVSSLQDLYQWENYRRSQGFRTCADSFKHTLVDEWETESGIHNSDFDD